MPLQGCDTSQHNTPEQIQVALKLDFVIAKCTEGNGQADNPDCVDPQYISTIDLVLKAKKRPGAYLFAHPENNPLDEADWFLRYAKLRPGQIAAVDFEPDPALFTVAEVATWGQWLVTVLNRIRNKTGCWPWLYLNENIARLIVASSSDAVLSALRAYPLWKAKPGIDIGDLFGFSPIAWQYDWTDIDKDVLTGTEQDWLATAVPQPGWEKRMKTKEELVALGKQLVASDPTQVWASEGPDPFGPIHNELHASWSEHALKEAIDFNYGHGPGAAGDCYPPEVHWVETVALPAAVNAGFAVRWMMSPGDHRDHLHTDCNRYGLSGVYGHDLVPTIQVKDLLKRIGQWHEGADPFYRSPEMVRSIQRAAGVKADGVYGDDTVAGVKALQWRLNFTGSHIKEDGVWGPATQKEYTAFCDGKLGEQTIRLWQRNAGTTVDGKISTPSELILKVQREDSKSDAVRAPYKLTGRECDGVLGKNTWKMIQDLMGIHIDGIAGKNTINALQRRLLRGRW